MTEALPLPVQRPEIVAGLEQLISLVRLLSPAGEMSLTTVSTLARLVSSGPHRLSDLALREGVTQPAMTQLVSRLERQALAERRGHPDDRRVVMVHITDLGRRVLAERRAHRADQLDRLIDALTPADQQAIAAAVPALSRLADLAAPAER